LDTRIKRTELQAARAVFAKLPDSEFAARYEVLRFRVIVERGSQPIDRHVTGAAFDANLQTVFSKLRNGDRVIFEDIKARLEGAPAGTRTYDLAPISWKVVD
jgi:hypothetical protein